MDSENQQICRDFVRPVILPLLNRQPPEKQAFRGVCPHPGLIFCTLLPLLGTSATIPPPSFLSNSTIATIVGYSTIDIPVGYSMFTPVFEDVAGGSFTLGDITVCNTSGVELDDNENGAGRCRRQISVLKLKDGKCEVAGAMAYTTGGYSTQGANWGWGSNKNVTLAAGEALIVNNENGVERMFKLKPPVSE